jgi:hypothetical protein
VVKISEREWTFRDTDYHLQAYVDPSGRHRPVFLVQEARDNRGQPLRDVRGDLAAHLAGCLESRPEQVTWIERGRSGELVQYDIRPYHQDLPTDQQERAHPSGGAIRSGRPRYNFIARELTREDMERLEVRLKDRLHPRASQTDLRGPRQPGRGRDQAPDAGPTPER